LHISSHIQEVALKHVLNIGNLIYPDFDLAARFNEATATMTWKEI